MTFVQRSAGNANRRRELRSGAVASSTQHQMTHRFLALITAVLALGLVAAPAQASDPLLSGYAGPGGGEQVVLGGGTVGGKDGGGSGSGGGDPAATPLKAASTPATTSSGTAPNAATGTSGQTTSTLTRSPQRKKSSSTSSQRSGDDDASATANGTSTTTAALPGAPAVVAYPSRSGDVGGLPLSAGGLLLLVLGLAAAALVALGLRRLSHHADQPPSGPQVPA